jgi:colicin import membrane protein
VLELVAGPGNDFRATEAPALGTPGGVKLSLPKATPATVVEPPKPEPPKPEPPKPEATKAEAPKPEASPITKAPAPPKAEPKQRTMAQNLRRQLIIAESKGRKQAAKEREAEQKRLTKEEFDKAQRAKVASAKSAPPKIDKIDTEGIRNGVIGGSKNSKAGAGGTALSVEEHSEVEGYAAMLNKLLTDALEEITGLEEGLRAEAEFEVQASGRLARGRIVKKSGNERFDMAVLHAIASVRMPEGPPKGFDRTQQVAFSSKGKN